MARARMIAEDELPMDVEGLRALFVERLVVALARGGFSSPGAVQRATDEELREVGGVGPSTLRYIREVLPVSVAEYAGGYVDTL